MRKIKTSKKIRKEIHRMSKVLGYSKEEEERNIKEMCSVVMTHHDYLYYLKSYMYQAKVLSLYSTEYDKDFLSKKDTPLKTSQMVIKMYDKYPKLWKNRPW